MFTRIDENKMVGVIEWENDDGEEIETEFLLKYAVCDRCDGKGKHVNPAVDGHGLAVEDFAEDPDFEESYFAGHYDVTCEECCGKRVVPVLAEEDESKLSEEQQQALEFVYEAAQHEAWDRQTQRMESGGWG